MFEPLRRHQGRFVNCAGSTQPSVSRLPFYRTLSSMGGTNICKSSLPTSIACQPYVLSKPSNSLCRGLGLLPRQKTRLAKERVRINANHLDKVARLRLGDTRFAHQEPHTKLLLCLYAFAALLLALCHRIFPNGRELRSSELVPHIEESDLRWGVPLINASLISSIVRVPFHEDGDDLSGQPIPFGAAPSSSSALPA